MDEFVRLSSRDLNQKKREDEFIHVQACCGKWPEYQKKIHAQYRQYQIIISKFFQTLFCFLRKPNLFK